MLIRWIRGTRCFSTRTRGWSGSLRDQGMPASSWIASGNGMMGRFYSVRAARENPRSRMGVFRSVVEPLSDDHPAGHLRNPRYRLRWDWHLRNLFYALLPGASVFMFVKWIEWSFAEEAEEFRKALNLAKEKDREEVIAPVVLSTNQLQSQIEDLRNEIEKLRQEGLEGREKQNQTEAKAVSEKCLASTSSKPAPA